MTEAQRLDNEQTEKKTDWKTACALEAIVSRDIPDHTRDSRCRSHRFCDVTGCLRHKAGCSVPMPTRLTNRRVAGRAGVHYSTCEGRA